MSHTQQLTLNILRAFRSFLFVYEMKTNIYSITVKQFPYMHILLSFNIYMKRKESFDHYYDIEKKTSVSRKE